MMTNSSQVRTGSRSREIKEQLDHPVIDSDGHMLEFEPAVFDFISDLAGSDVVERFRSQSFATNNFGSYCRNWLGQFLTPEARLDDRAPRSPWWGIPAKRTFDRAAASLPALLYENLDEVGLDFTVLFPTFGLYVMGLDVEEFRLAGVRAINMYNAEAVRGLTDRMTSVAVIPMHTPDEAVAELEFAVNELGFKAVTLQSHVIRPVPKMVREHPDLAHYSHWIDNFCLDSIYDYEPVWAKCVELGVSPTFHTPGYGWGTRASVSNWMHNHIGAFACGAESAARALFFGGVPQRYPELRFGFLEGGVGWAATLFGDTIGHWKKRNRKTVMEYDPAQIDQVLLRDLFAKYGGTLAEGRLDRVGVSEMPFTAFAFDRDGVDQTELDEFARSGVESPEDIKAIFDRYYIGCEADDPTNAFAFNDRVNPLGTKLNTLLSSDIGHFDVPDITEVLKEAYELVEDGLIDDDDFRAFTFGTPARFWTATNPDFFAGTVVEKAVAALGAHEGAGSAV
jgi:predicted TIM-barrel fold metal-dependent hydrolase